MGAKDELRQRGRGGGTRSARGTTPTRADSEFVNFELDKDQTAAYRQWRDDAENVITLWTELLEGGYRVNTKYDDYSSSIACFIIPDADSENEGYILTGRGGNAYRAISEAIFKHSEIFHGNWSVAAPAKARLDDPDF